MLHQGDVVVFLPHGDLAFRVGMVKIQAVFRQPAIPENLTGGGTGGITLVMLLLILRQRIGPLGLGRIFASLVKMSLATAGMCLTAYPLYGLARMELTVGVTVSSMA